MRRLALGALLGCMPVAAHAQRVPARDLLAYPLGLIGEAAAFGSGAASGLWNPATGILEPNVRVRLGVAALNAPIDLALAGQVLHAAFVVRGAGTVSIGVVRAAIKDLAHTETDPQSIGPDIPYTTTVLSAGLSRRVHAHVVAGAAIRAHSGHVDDQFGHAFVTDVGVMAERLSRFDIRAAASTYLLTFVSDNDPSITAAVDARVWQYDSTTSVRAGVAHVSTRGAATERYVFVEGRAGKLTVRGGPVQMQAYGHSSQRLRLGLAFRHEGYAVGVAREDNENGLTPTYQLAITGMFR